jgi:hypothetical protein
MPDKPVKVRDEVKFRHGYDVMFGIVERSPLDCSKGDGFRRGLQIPFLIRTEDDEVYFVLRENILEIVKESREPPNKNPYWLSRP